LKGRVFETSLGDLNNSDDAFRKFKLIIEDVQGNTCLTNFQGMDMTTDKLRSMIKKKQVNSSLNLLSSFSYLLNYLLKSTIEAHTDVKTTDGYVLRFFTLAFTKNQPGTNRTTAYAQHNQVRLFKIFFFF
jgi:small subunit ribosomal protein S3Ae